jgi:hypothetical protein
VCVSNKDTSSLKYNDVYSKKKVQKITYFRLLCIGVTAFITSLENSPSASRTSNPPMKSSQITPLTPRTQHPICLMPSLWYLVKKGNRSLRLLSAQAATVMPPSIVSGASSSMSPT